MNKAIFLDRDGTLNRLAPGEYIIYPKELILLPGAAAAIKKFNTLGFLVIVITNQGVIARGKATKRHIEEFNEHLIERFNRHDANIDAIYYCPHHPRGTVKEHAITCHCRKPEPGMILKALKKFNIDPKQSFMIGDTTGDILAGKRAKLKTILVKTGYGGSDRKYDAKPDFTVRDLTEAVRIIKKF